MSGPFGSSQWMYNASSGFYDFEISNSVRLGETGHLTHTNGSDSASRQKFTFATWLKITSLSTAHHQLFDATNNYGRIYFTADDSGGNTVRVLMGDGSSNGNLVTTRKFRDTSSWFHIVVAVDTTEGTAGDRIKIYINGVRETSFAAETDVNQNVITKVGGTALELIGAQAGPDTYFKGYLAETHYIVNAQLTAASFGETKNDIWIPKDTAGLTYGTNGYRLQYKQTGTSADSSGIGADTSGNDNHWTPVNLVASDVVPDSPTNNFATMNPLFRGTNNNRTISEGNLKYQPTGDDIFVGNFGISSGKHYYEIFVNDVEGTNNYMSLTQETFTGFQDAVNYRSGSGEIIDDLSGASTQTSLSNASNGDIVSISADLDGGTVQFKLNNSNVGSAVTIPSGTYFAAIGNGNSSISGAKIFTFNFGQDSSFAGAATAQNNADDNGIGDFYYAPPSGFLAMCTSNMTAPVATIDPAQGGSPQDYFNTVLYTGNGSDNRSITGAGFDPDWVWIKARNEGYSHVLGDSVRGDDKFLSSNATGAEDTNTGAIQDFITDGFQVGTIWNVNQDTKTYASWNWKAGTAFSNDASATGVGSIDSAGSVSADVGFSIISYTGNNTDGATVAHGLGVVPSMIITKSRSAASLTGWMTKHKDLASNYNLILNGTDAAWNPSSNGWVGDLNNTATFSLENGGTNGNNANQDTITYIAYCFASVDGYSKFGSYTGNGNADGTFVYTGFRPAFVIAKRTDSTSSWQIWDNARDISNVTTHRLRADLVTAEDTGGVDIDMLSNGFKLRNTGINLDTGNYIFLAFAEQPFKYANAR